MLYGDFKKQFKNDSSSSTDEYKFDDTRTNISTNTQNQTRKKRKNHFKIIVIIVLIISIFISSILLYFDLFEDEGINGLLACFSEKPDYIYCLSAGSFSTQKEAIALSDNLIELGCAGYIHYDGLFHVLISFYLNEDDANAVSQKTSYTIYKIFKSSNLKSIPSTIKGEYDKCKNFDQDILTDLYNATVIIEKNNDTITAKQIITNTFTKATASTSEFIKNAVNVNDINIQKHLSKINSVLSELNKLTNNITLSSIRFTAIFIALTMA